MLGKWRDPGYRKEQSSGGYDAEFLLTGLAPKNAGMYFCAYKMTGSHEWSEKSEYLQLEVTGAAPTVGPAPPPADARTVFVSTFSCLAIFLLFPAVFLIYRCSQHELAIPNFPRRRPATEDPQEGTCVDGNSKAPAEAASVPAQEPPGPGDCTAVKV
ncbi:PREDICTED: V-set and transmembrane domain-containing protein 1-like [Miniopterus natalensis]|uniref:V-set and transmembrane domain-containing protein 1-like n=1 Tax=Miniopterus natalensis TaxID=291302 RepID=UPI0007A727B5|nr:PREDICTED: V-set and transmembrane domain-containing protein 1-like [Miniopterus natalensis]